jgi:hypothetical protein
MSSGPDVRLTGSVTIRCRKRNIDTSLTLRWDSERVSLETPEDVDKVVDAFRAFVETGAEYTR